MQNANTKLQSGVALIPLAPLVGFASKGQHRQVVSTKGFSVDVGIKRLVVILNSNPQIETFESCQGGYGKSAFVCFDYKGTISETLHFAEHIAKHFAKQAKQSSKLINPAYELDISVKWCGDKVTPFIELCMPPEVIDYVTSIFSHGGIEG